MIWLLDADGEPVEFIERFVELRRRFRYYEAGGFALTLPVGRPRLRRVQEAALVVAFGRAYLLDEITADDETVEIAGRDLKGVIWDRYVAGTGYGTFAQTTVEGVVKDYINANLGPGAEVPRQMPGLTIEPLRGYSETVTAHGIEARSPELGEALSALLKRVGLGMDISGDVMSTPPRFEIFTGQDRTETVILSPGGETISAREFQRQSVVNVVYEFGDETGGYAVATSENLPAAPNWSRKETSQATNDALDLSAAALQALYEEGGSDAYAQELAPGAYEWGVDLGLGDEIRIRDASWDIDRTARVVGATVVHDERGDTMEIELDRPLFTR